MEWVGSKGHRDRVPLSKQFTRRVNNGMSRQKRNSSTGGALRRIQAFAPERKNMTESLKRVRMHPAEEGISFQTF